MADTFNAERMGDMARPLLLWLVGMVSAIMPSVAYAELHERFAGVLLGKAFQRTELTVVDEPELAGDLFALAIDQNIQPSGATFKGANDDVLIIPLESERSGDDDSLTLFFDRKSKTSFFLLLDADSKGGGSVRLWSDGPTEIVIDAQGIYYSPIPSADTFRLPAHESGKSVSDNILCLAR